VRAGWVCKRVGDRPVGTLTEFMAAINEARERGISEASIVFELGPSSSAKAAVGKAKSFSEESAAGGAKKKGGLFGALGGSSGSSRKKNDGLLGEQAGGEAGPGAQGGSSASIKIQFLVGAFAQTLGPDRQLAPAEEQAWFSAHDANGDGVISLNEFTAAINTAKEMSKKQGGT